MKPQLQYKLKSIPVLLDGKDLLAQAQTGTGKTAAFALPIIPNIDIDIKHPQALIIAPTRELAIQVAEAFKSYAKILKALMSLVSMAAKIIAPNLKL